MEKIEDQERQYESIGLISMESQMDVEQQREYCEQLIMDIHENVKKMYVSELPH